MICKHCGKESTTADRCSQCGNSLTSPLDTEATPDLAPIPKAPGLNQNIVTDGDADLRSQRVSAPVPDSPTTTGKRNARPPAPAIMPRARQSAPAVVPPVPPSSSRPPLPEFSTVVRTLNAEDQTSVTSSEPLNNPVLIGASGPAVHAGPTLLNPDAEPFASSTAPQSRQVPLSQSPVAATAPRRLQEEPEKSIEAEPNAMALTGRFAAVFLLILIIQGALIYFAHDYFAAPLLIAEFLGGLLLPIMRVVPWSDEDSGDLALFILFTLIFGPTVALVSYVLLGLIRQEVNPALVGCLIVAALARITAQIALGHVALTATMPFAQIGEHNLGIHLVSRLLIDWSGLVTLAGWYAAGVFRKFDE